MLITSPVQPSDSSQAMNGTTQPPPYVIESPRITIRFAPSTISRGGVGSAAVRHVAQADTTSTRTRTGRFIVRAP